MASKVSAARKRAVAGRTRILAGRKQEMTAAGHAFSVEVAPTVGTRAEARLRRIQSTQRRLGERVTGKRR